MTTAPKVAAVIVTYNRLEKLRLTLEQTLAQPFYQVIVINNASTDGTADYLNSLADARLQIVHKPENTGGAGGFAQGFKLAARESEADWLVCYDDDAYPAPDALARFVELTPGADVGGVAAAVYFPDGSICPMNRPGMDIFRSPLSIAKAFLSCTSLTGMAYNAYEGNKPVEVFFSSFVGLFVRCALIRGTVGLPRAELFVYRDDSLYTLAITRVGYKLLFVPDIRFVHDCSTLTSNKPSPLPLWKVYYMNRNDVIFFKKLAGNYFCIALFLLFLRRLAKLHSYNQPMYFLKTVWMAFCDGIQENCRKSHEMIVRSTSNF